MAAGGIVAWRMAGPGIGLSVLALMAFSPMQIHFSQHALIDGFFAFWALLCFWTTWECLRAPTSRGWPVAHGILLAILPVAKLENAFFVCCGLGGILAGNRWLKIGAISPRLLLASILGPAAGILFLVALAGGADTFVAIYKVLVAKAGDLPYAQLTGDGPWYRYLIDMMTLSPLVVLLAVGGVFRLGGRRKEIVFAAAFVAASYAVMCNVRYGMNLRYTSIWEMPFRLCAAALVADLCARFRGRGWLAAALAVAALCAYDLRQYRIFSGDPSIPLYELVTNDLLRLVRILKSPSDFGL
jgi:4-amino-4-deoxy-L-arabinose transferase-like glycosyltransferase